MRDYPVPFSTREETPFLFNLAIREMCWLGAGIFIGTVISLTVFFLFIKRIELAILCLPIIAAFAGTARYISIMKVREDDHIVHFDRHLINNLKYRLKCHEYINYRRG